MYLILHLAGFILVMKTNRFSMPTLSLYYLNPLVIIEGIGNLHIEVVLVSFLALSLYFYEYHRLYLALLFYSLAIHTKLTPLMFLPFIFLYLLKIKNMKAITLLIFMIGIGFLPFALSHNATGFSSSLDLYFRKFEFNGGIYNLLKYIGSMVLGYNPIHIVGPLLSLIFFIYILYLVYKHNHIDLTHQSEAGWIELYSHWAGLTLFTHLLFSTTVHPWYLITVLFLTILWEVNLIVIWSYLITLTYIQYDGGVFQTNYWIIGLEYSILFLMMFKDQNFLNFLFKK
jgi:Gpi18-like mannosyltransferase